MGIDSLMKIINKSNSNNFKVVNIRKPHKCGHCGKQLTVGTECITVNKKSLPRKWYCKDCVELQLEIIDAQCRLNNTVFNDEGGALANMQYLDELESDFISKQR
jgi:hypothetical protein